jgi:hypothetical protein
MGHSSFAIFSRRGLASTAFRRPPIASHTRFVCVEARCKLFWPAFSGRPGSARLRLDSQRRLDSPSRRQELRRLVGSIRGRRKPLRGLSGAGPIHEFLDFGDHPGPFVLGYGRTINPSGAARIDGQARPTTSPQRHKVHKGKNLEDIRPGRANSALIFVQRQWVLGFFFVPLVSLWWAS